MPTREDKKRKEEEMRRAIRSGNPALGSGNKPYTVVQGASPSTNFKPATNFKPQTDFTQTGNPSNIKGNMGFTGYEKNTGTFIGGSGTVNRLNKKYLQNPSALQGGGELPVDARAREMMQGLGEGAKNRYSEMAQGANKMSSGLTTAINEAWPKKMPGTGGGGQSQGRGLSLGDMRGDFVTGANKMAGDVQRGINEASVSLPRNFTEIFKPGMSAGDMYREMQGLPPLPQQAGQGPDQAKVYTGKIGDPPTTTPTAPPNTVSQPPQTGTSQAPPTAMQNQQSYQGKTGNRYLDMAYAGSDELQKYIQGMPEGDRPIDLIRGTDRSFYDPRSQQEYATMAEAAFGVNRPDIMEQYGLEAPLESAERRQIMEMMGKGQEGPEYSMQTMMGEGGEEAILFDKTTGKVKNLGNLQNIQRLQEMASPQDIAELFNTVIPDMMVSIDNENTEEYVAKRNKLRERNPALFMLWEQYTGGAN